MHQEDIKIYKASYLDSTIARTAAVVFFRKSILTLVESLVG